MGDKVHAAKCAAPTKVDAATLSVANLTKTTRTAFLEKLVDEVTAATTKTATDLGDLHTCWAKTTGDALLKPLLLLLLKKHSMLQKLIAEKNGTHGTLPLLLNGLPHVNIPMPLLTKVPKEEVLSSVLLSV